MKSRLRYILAALAGLLCTGFFYCVIRFSVVIYHDVQAHNTRVAESYEYTKKTTPLSQAVIDDICLKFAIGPNDTRCQSGAVVYGPDFFSEIKKYLNKLPRQKNITPIVNEKLGAYLVDCDGSTKGGIYRCRYDLRGDGWYPIFIYFTKEGFFYRILVPTGGS